MRTVTLSGWGQSADTLTELSLGAPAIDYAHHANVADALEQIAREAADAERIIGWSLGGQLAVRAIASGMIRPEMLVLIAAPYQFVARPERKLGMPEDVFAMFRQNYAEDADRTLTKAWASILKGDIRASAIRPYLEVQDRNSLREKQWLNWLDHLQSFTCDDLDLSVLPPTLLIHGEHDAVVHHNQSPAFRDRLPQATLFTVEGCGHAPHWHNKALVIKTIRDFT